MCVVNVLRVCVCVRACARARTHSCSLAHFSCSLPLILTGGRLNFLPFCIRPAPKDEDELDEATDQLHVKEQ
jgi:hypothetical protein